MINYIFFPKSKETPENLKKIVTEVFNKHTNSINSATNKLPSNSVLEILKPELEALGFQVEKGKTTELKIQVPVLFGKNGQIEKSFDADAYNKKTKTVVEVEAGRGYTNYQFLKDLFQASVMVTLTTWLLQLEIFIAIAMISKR